MTQRSLAPLSSRTAVKANGWNHWTRRGGSSAGDASRPWRCTGQTKRKESQLYWRTGTEYDHVHSYCPNDLVCCISADMNTRRSVIVGKEAQARYVGTCLRLELVRTESPTSKKQRRNSDILTPKAWSDKTTASLICPRRLAGRERNDQGNAIRKSVTALVAPLLEQSYDSNDEGTESRPSGSHLVLCRATIHLQVSYARA